MSSTINSIEDFDLSCYGIYLQQYSMEQTSLGDLPRVEMTFVISNSNPFAAFQQLSHDLQMVNKYLHNDNPQVNDLLEKAKVLMALTKE